MSFFKEHHSRSTILYSIIGQKSKMQEKKWGFFEKSAREGGEERGMEGVKK